jgi:glycerol-3-phosphate dehydrogenase
MTSPGTAPSASSALTATRRHADLLALADGAEVDLLVVGLGVTGAGVALDAASRGLRVVAVDAHDIAFGTSRWSSKLVHGGLRYLARGQLAVAHESAVERGVLMTRVAPHLTRALPMVMPLGAALRPAQAALAMQGLRAGDGLRRVARTSSDLLPPPRRISATETLRLAPSVRRAALRGALLQHDGQLEDDARLVVALARTAAAHGARVLTRVRAGGLTGDRATLTDELSGSSFTVRARAVVNATGVWAAGLVPELELTPSRGTHLVVRSDALPGTHVALSAPVAGSVNRFVFTLPQPDGLTYLGLTDEATDEVPDVPVPSEHEVDFLLATINQVLETPLGREHVVGRFAGLRPLLRAAGSTADLSRRHAVLVSDDGVVTVVGGKLTTYRRMAEDAVDQALRTSKMAAPVSRTRDLPLVGAAPREVLLGVDAPGRLVRRYGVEAPLVLADAVARTGEAAQRLLEPLAAHVPVTRAELLWGVTHEGALDVDDLLDRRTRVGLVDGDRRLAEDHARWALQAAIAAH